MGKVYKKGGKVYSEILSLVLDGVTYTPPTDEQLMKAGYDIEYEKFSNEPPIGRPYDEIVVEKIRQKYSMDDELAILRQRDSKPEEFMQYNRYCEECKKAAKEEVC